MPNSTAPQPPFSSADIGALAHLYRGELYRSTVWRTRLDSTTNWAVVTTGIALTVTFSTPHSSALPLLLAGLLVTVFLATEARRYRFYDFWRVRAHVMELYFYGPILMGHGPQVEGGWNEILARDYRYPQLHISFVEALGRRIRRNYAWILMIQAVSYFGKLLIHPEPITSFAEIVHRAEVGPLPGSVVLTAGLAFHATWAAIGLWTLTSRRGIHSPPRPNVARDRILELAQGHAPLVQWGDGNDVSLSSLSNESFPPPCPAAAQSR